MTVVRLVRSTVNLPELGRDAWVYVDWPPTPRILGLIRATYLVLESGNITLDDTGVVLDALPPGGTDGTDADPEEEPASEDQPVLPSR